MSDMAMAASYINGWMDDHEPLAWHDVAVAKGMFDMALYLVGLSDADVIESIIENDIPRIK